MKRRLPGCYLCGDPTVGEWFCVAHLWAGNPAPIASANGLKKISRDHAFWIERFSPKQILELADHLGRS